MVNDFSSRMPPSRMASRRPSQDDDVPSIPESPRPEVPARESEHVERSSLPCHQTLWQLAATPQDQVRTLLSHDRLAQQDQHCRDTPSSSLRDSWRPSLGTVQSADSTDVRSRVLATASAESPPLARTATHTDCQSCGSHPTPHSPHARLGCSVPSQPPRQRTSRCYSAMAL